MVYGHFSRSPGGTFKHIMGLFKSLVRLFQRERTVTQLAKWLDVPEVELREWLGRAPMWARGYEYDRFTIPKRRGGTRTISAPNEKLKALQRRILYRLLNPLPMHSAATGFARSLNCRQCTASRRKRRRHQP